MAELTNSPRKILQVEEIEGEYVQTDDYFFCKIGDSIPLTSDNVVFDANSVPSKPLALSPRFGLIFAAHSSGFCVAKTKDVYAAAKEIKAEESSSTVQELSVVDVDVGRVSILTLSDDSSYVSAVVETEIHVFFVNSLLNKDIKPMFSCSVEANFVKDIIWIKDTEHSFIVLTDRGKLHLGSINKTLTVVMDEIDAVEKSVDGQCLAIGRKNNLSILSTQFKEILQIVLPLGSFTGDNSAIDTVKVDSIRWVRSDSIVVGFLQQNEEGEEQNYFLQVIMSEDGKFINGSSRVTALQFNDLFPGIVDDIVPYGCGPHLFMNYLDNCELSFVSNRKNTDQHIMLLSWSQGDTSVSAVDIERDTWLPRIELQENGDDNLVLGLCVDETSVYDNVEVKVDVAEHRELRPQCLLVCLTLEGKLVMFNVASISGCQPSSQDLSAFSHNAQNIPVVSYSNPKVDPHSEKVRPKQFNTENINSAPDGPIVKDPTTSENFNASLDGQNMRKDSDAGNDRQRTLMEANTFKPFGNSSHSPQDISTQFSLIGSQAKVGEIEMGKVALPDKSLEKKMTYSNKDASIKIDSGLSHNNSTPIGSNSYPGFPGISDARSPFFQPSSTSTKGNLSGFPFSSTESANNAGTLSGNLALRSSDSFNSPVEKAANHNQETTKVSGVSEMAHCIPNSRLQSREAVISRDSTSHNTPLMKRNHQCSPFGQLNSEQNASEQIGNVQNMAKKLDKLLESIEERGNLRDICTIDHRSSLEALEEGMRNLSERSSVCQNISVDRRKEIEILFDKTIEVLARKTYMEGIVKQTTDEQYLDMWDCQKLSSELYQKQQSISNLNQDLVNQMIELEKHFNALELNRFGESTGANLVSRSVHCRSAASRYSQPLNAIHNATAAAEHLSDFLSKQMAVLSVKSPPPKQSSVKKRVFETIGIPCPNDSLASPNMAKVFESPLSKHPLVSSSAVTHNEFSGSQLSGQRSEFETSRRRRDSLDKNWAKFEVPKTTVKRTLVQSERQNGSGLFSSRDKRFVSPFNLEGSMATHSKNLTFPDMSGGKDRQEKMNSDTIATSAFKWAGTIPETSQLQAEQYSRSPAVRGKKFSTAQNIFASSSSLSSPSSLRVPDISHVTAEKSGSQVGYIGKPDTASVDRKPFGSQFELDNPTIQNIQPQPPSQPRKYDHMTIPSSKEIELTKPDDRSSSIDLTNKHDVQFSSQSRPRGTSTDPSSSLPTTSVTALSVASIEGSLETIGNVFKDAGKEVSQIPPSVFSIPVAYSQATPLNLISSMGPPRKDSSSTGSSVGFAQDSLKISSRPLVDKVSADTNSPTTSQSSQKMAPSADDKLKSEASTPSATLTKAPNSFGASNVVSNVQTEKQSTTFTENMATIASNVTSNVPPPEKQFMAFPTPSVSTTDGISNTKATITQEDEMEEEAPETNQTSGFSLGSLAGFGLGSSVSATATKSNPFGVSLSNTSQSTPSSSSPFTVPQGQLFRPASFNFQSPVSQQSQSPNTGPTSGAFGSASTQHPPAASGFGQPGQIGFGGGQQALGSVLGSFGQSRQIGAGLPSGGFGGTPSSGGLTGSGGGGGFAGASPPTGGFAGIAATSGGFAGIGATAGGFAAAATPGGGFAAAAPSGGGFAAAANSGGFAATGSGGGGFGAFSNPGTGGFGAGATGGIQPPSQLFTQMRR